MKLKKLEPIVLQVLEGNTAARNNDFILYGAVLERMGFDVWKTSLGSFLFISNILRNAPPFESVTRCRRKLQKERPDLASDNVRKKRNEKQAEYIEYNRC